jgi:hypothetical protein
VSTSERFLTPFQGVDQWRVYLHALCDSVGKDEDLVNVLQRLGLDETNINLMKQERKQIKIVKKWIKKNRSQGDLEDLFKPLTIEAKLVYMAQPKEPKAHCPIALHLALQHVEAFTQSR